MLVITTGDIGTIAGTVAADLTGATAQVNIAMPNGGGVVNKSATIGDPAEGEWSITYADDDFPSDGIYRLEIEVTFSNGEVQTFAYGPSRSQLRFRVRKQIG